MRVCTVCYNVVTSSTNTASLPLAVPASSRCRSNSASSQQSFQSVSSQLSLTSLTCSDEAASLATTTSEDRLLTDEA